MSEKHTFQALKIEQNGYKFYICSMKGSIIKKISSTSMNEMGKHSEIYQRSIDESRARKIGKFIDRKNSLLPTAIILNSREKIEYNEATNELTLSSNNNSFFIIDGQHRIKGSEYATKDIEFVVVITDSLDLSMQTELFISINNEQKRVNPSVRFNLYSNDKEKTPERVIRHLAHLMNSTNDSPFYHKIRMDDSKRNASDSSLSLAAFASPLVSLIYYHQDYFEFKDELNKNNCFESIDEELMKDSNNKYKERLLWTFYYRNQEKVMYKIIWNYFTAISDVFKEQWSDKKSIIYKTTGYNAFVIVFKHLLKMAKNERDFSLDFFKKHLQKTQHLGDNLYSDYYGVGQAASYKLARDILKNLMITDDIDYEFIHVTIDESDN
jgi:DGQHR domain-containing protein